MESKPFSRQEAKSATRERVVRVASRAIRRDGIAGAGIAAIMAEAGLTHGGFYAHFRSKDALTAAAIDAAFAESSRRLSPAVAGMPGAAALAAWIDIYVSTRHRDDRERGCVLTALSGEAGRTTAEVKDALSRGLERLTRQVAGWVTDLGNSSPLETATSLLSEAVGAVTLARVMGRTVESDTFLAGARAALRRRAGIN